MMIRHIYICAKDLFEAKYQYLISNHIDVGKKI